MLGMLNSMWVGSLAAPRLLSILILILGVWVFGKFGFRVRTFVFGHSCSARGALLPEVRLRCPRVMFLGACDVALPLI